MSAIEDSDKDEVDARTSQSETGTTQLMEAKPLEGIIDLDNIVYFRSAQ